MPELPEVETIRLGLQRYLVGHKIKSVEIRLPKIFTGNTGDIIGAKALDVKRFGKGLVIDFDNYYSLAIHLKLTGQLIYVDRNTGSKVKFSEKTGGSLPNKWTCVVFYLDKNSVLYYNDLRQFGWIKIVKTNEVLKLPFFKELGPEPFKDLTFEKFKEIVLKSNLVIKVLQMSE